MRTICLLLLLITATHAQTGAILPNNYTEWRQPIRQTNTIPIYSYDTTAYGIIMTKVAEISNGNLIVFDSMRAETIIRNEYLKIKQ